MRRAYRVAPCGLYRREANAEQENQQLFLAIHASAF
jgi:hypothetical protein